MSIETEIPASKSHLKQPQRRFPPQLTAWLVLILAFGLFCLLTWLIASALIDYFSSSIKLQQASVTALSDSEVSVLHAGQERFLLVSQNQSESVSQGDLVRTAQSSKARLLFFDGTSLELSSNSEVQLNEYQVRITNFVQKEKRIFFEVIKGVVNIKVEPLDLDEYSKGTIKATTSEGTEIFFNDQLKGNYPSGSYTIDVEGNLANRVTWVTSLTANRSPIDVRAAGQTRLLAPDQRFKIVQGQPPELPLDRELVSNGAFIDGFDYWKEQHDQGGDGGKIQGRALPDSEMVDDGTITRAHILRYESQGNFEETSLRQDLNTDVREYTSLIFKLKGRLRLQSLPGGGVVGNEYPLFIKINYVDRDGQTRDLFRGFYFKAADANTRTYDRVGSQLLGSLQWKENKWEQFELDLTNQLLLKPAYLNYIVVGSAGHDFESYFTEVSLIAKLRNS
ncbi:MAG: hypothetical protein WCS37_19430 [Chloroflexota bacterium]|nr:FecR domain-containing protein [Chloroflexota bacterium]